MRVFIASLKIMKLIAVLSLLIAGAGAGCVTQPPPPPASEADVLFDVTQLTRDFGRAGEAYFAPDSRAIVFQATPKGEEQYSMYVAPLLSESPAYPVNRMTRTQR